MRLPVAPLPSLARSRNNNRVFSTEASEASVYSEEYPWKLRAGIILERIPPVMPPYEPWEKEYYEWQAARQARRRREMPKVMFDPYDEFDYAADQAANEEYVPASVVTKEDEANDLRSMNRRLCEHLYLIVQQDGVWRIPSGNWTRNTSLRQSANVQLLDVFSDELDHFILGNAPIGCVEEGDTRTFFFHTLYCSGDIKVVDGKSDFMWATKEEVLERLEPKEAEMCDEILITLKPRNQWIYGGEPQECARAVSERAFNEKKA